MTFLSSSKGKLYQPLEAETEDAESLTDTSAYNSGSYTEKKSLSKQLQGADAYLFRPLAALAPVFFVLLVLSLLWNPYFSPSSSTSPSFIPQLSSESRTFDPNTIYDTPSSTESDKAWDELMPPGRGYVLVPNSYDLRLESGIPTDAGIDRYAISGFHQVHCLGIIRKAYYAALDGKDIYLFGEAGADSETLQKYHVEHIGHW
ncbi:hypothetical protein MMC25_008133 [Agyrium rufum]|nr:hypothetical protein [Agyrium rufum]